MYFRFRCYRLQFQACYLRVLTIARIYINIDRRAFAYAYAFLHAAHTRSSHTHMHTHAFRMLVYTRQRCETMTMRMCACIHAYMRANGAYACAYVVSVAAVRQVRGTVDQSEASPWPGGAQPSASSITCVLSCRDITCHGGIVHRNKSTLAKYPFVCEEIKRTIDVRWDFYKCVPRDVDV